MPFEELRADDDELKVPNGPILLNADDIKLVIPTREEATRV